MAEPLLRLFFALLPPPGVVPEMARHRGAMGVRRDVADDRLHVTLLLLGVLPSWPPEWVRRVVAAVAAAPLGACRIVFDQVVGGDRSALLAASEPLRGVERLRHDLGRTVAGTGLLPAPAGATRPHATLGYGGAPAPARPIDPISWKASSLTLIESEIGRTRHNRLGQWPLVG